MITFKDRSRKRLKEEFDEMHPAARAVMRELACYLQKQYSIDLVITCIGRTDKEMARIYGDDWKKKKRFSWHLTKPKYRAFDARNKTWPAAVKIDVTRWLKKNWPGLEVLMHDVGNGDHLHVAVPSIWSMFKRLKRLITKRSKGA